MDSDMGMLMPPEEYEKGCRLEGMFEEWKNDLESEDAEEEEEEEEALATTGMRMDRRVDCDGAGAKGAAGDTASRTVFVICDRRSNGKFTSHKESAKMYCWAM